MFEPLSVRSIAGLPTEVVCPRVQLPGHCGSPGHLPLPSAFARVSPSKSAAANGFVAARRDRASIPTKIERKKNKKKKKKEKKKKNNKLVLR